MTRSKLWGWIVERLRSPARVLLAGAVICVLAVAGATSFALATPSLGLRLAADFDAGTVHVVAAQGP